VGPNVVLRFALVDSTEEGLARQLYEASTRDSLTRAFNRRHFGERLASEVAYAVRHESHVGVLLMDIDHFKRVNDTHGHLAGDFVLRVVAAQIARTIRLEDTFARYGGEEFVILCRGIDETRLGAFGERIRRAVEKIPLMWESQELRVTISIGVSTLDQLDGDRATGETMLALADERLYTAKRLGRNRVCVR
jgi:diguanylate cyclase (GGDEF)-like protein